MSIKEIRLIQVYKKLEEESFASTRDKKFLFLFFSGLFFVLFFLTFYLINKNPFSLLIPFSLYDTQFFLYDKRTPVTIFLSDGKGNLLPVQKKIFKTNQLREDIKKILIEISEPPYFEMDYSNFDGVQRPYKKLPNIHFALIQAWVRNDTLILDFRESTLKEEAENQRVRVEKGVYEVGEVKESSQLAQEKALEDKNKILLQNLKKDLLKYSFQVLEKTIFENFPQIKYIEYRLDGKQKELEGLDYKLTERKARS